VPNEWQITAVNGNCCGVMSIIKLTFTTIDVPNNEVVSTPAGYLQSSQK
jgi:hypothetical protein